MTFNCGKCNKSFRDNYALKRHTNKKTPCVHIILPEVLQDTQPNVTVINNTININLVLGQDDISNFDPEKFIEEWRNINKLTHEEYIRAGKLIISFHEMVMENIKNHNIMLNSTKSMTAMVINNNGDWKHEPVDEVVDKVIKVRSGQLVSLKDTIEITNDRVFLSESNQRTWKHLEQFHKLGREHLGTGDQTRRLRTVVKVALI